MSTAPTTTASTAEQVVCERCGDVEPRGFDEQTQCTACIDEDAYQARTEGPQMRALIPTTTTRRN